ncbi:hepatitis A virus cellular receptor 1 homolog [Mugil cephalus]|uniref:hepatitis A virus cellular receptor 1 homolog n=1 Tax=Mugil cephalus TaxID=48193 RepID=UPI001FB81F52|nr:hepatitis A virus cellular receptor 1 homolog [Mugil cephalus]
MRGLSYFFLSALIHVSSGTPKVIGYVGRDVILPCSYDTQHHDDLSFCWGQGKVPVSKCSNTVLSFLDGAVSFRLSPRYQLLGHTAAGELSLTILNAQRSDAGVYGCRVEIPGLFNDQKVNIKLIMEEAPVEQPVTQNSTISADRVEETLPTSTPEYVEVDERTLEMIQSVTPEGNFKALLRVENVSRMAAILFFPLIIILVFIFRRSFVSRGTRANTSAAENIYESIPMH